MDSVLKNLSLLLLDKYAKGKSSEANVEQVICKLS